MSETIELNLHDLVSEAIRNGIENGYNFQNVTLNDLALDLVIHDADIEAFPVEEVLKILIEKLTGNDNVK